MAARLNTPADFTVSSQAGPSTNEQYGLVPPSMFETTRASLPPRAPPPPRVTPPPQTDPDEPWRDLAKATAEILTLQEENKKLRSEQHGAYQYHTVQPIRARVDVHHENPTAPPPLPTVSAVNINHVDQIIQRQAAEIISLQQRLNETEAGQQKSVVQWEGQASLREARHEQQLTTLQNELTSRTERHAQQLKDKEAELSRVVADSHQKVVKLEAVLSRCQGDAQSEAGKLMTRVGQLEAHLETTCKELEETTRVKDVEVKEATRQLSQLKTYVAETETAHRSQDTWRRELENLTSQVKMREDEVAQLTQQMSLSTVRLQAQDRILTLQEDHLSKVKDGSVEKKKTMLLTKWREKVYELMVQAKTAEITTKHQEHNWVLKLQGVTDKLQAVEADIMVQRAAVDDKEAQLKLLAHQKAIVEGELTRAQDVAISLDDQAHHHTQLVRQLAQFTHNLYQKYSETLQQQARVDAALKAYDQRVNFAAGRVCMLQGQFSRREALLKMKYEEEPTHDKESPPEDDPCERAALGTELARVTEERDALVRQQQEDAHLLEDKVTTARQRVEGEVRDLKANMDRLQQQIHLKNQEIDTLHEEVSVVRTELNGLQVELDRVTQEAASTEMHIRKDAESRLEAERSQMTETLAEMEHRVNECRREQTKAVVGLRQLERAAARDKERAAQHLTSVQKDYQDKITQLERKLQAVEKDRNILMTTLRQEGLIRQCKAQRLAPITSDHAGKADHTDIKPTPPATSTLKHSEPLTDIIDDLKSLTAEVMEDGEDSS